MKKHIKNLIIVVSIFILGVNYAFAIHTDIDSIINKADSEYQDGKYTDAINLYKKALQTPRPSADIWYNLGNCYFRTGNTHQAILSYERALRLNPSDNDIRDNLAFVNSRLIDKKGFDGSFLSRSIHAISTLFPTNTWAVLALLLFVLSLICIGVYMFSKNLILRKFGFFGCGSLGLICLIFIFFSYKSFRIQNARNEAIIVTPSSILSTSPRAPQNSSEEVMLLHEGAKVIILDSVKNSVDSIHSTWYDVSFDNDHRAWISSKDVEII